MRAQLCPPCGAAAHSCDVCYGAGLDDAEGFWALLIPHGLQGGALAHIQRDDDVDMTGEEGWKEDYTQWWFDFLNQRGGKGVSKDTWQMVSALRCACRAGRNERCLVPRIRPEDRVEVREV